MGPTRGSKIAKTNRRANKPGECAIGRRLYVRQGLFSRYDICRPDEHLWGRWRVSIQERDVTTGNVARKAERPRMTAKLWVDVEDLFEYAGETICAQAAFSAWPSKCVRRCGRARIPPRSFVSFAMRPRGTACASCRLPKSRRSSPGVDQIRTGSIAATQAILPYPPSRLFVRKLVHRLPPTLRLHVIAVLLTQFDAASGRGSVSSTRWRAGLCNFG